MRIKKKIKPEQYACRSGFMKYIMDKNGKELIIREFLSVEEFETALKDIDE